MKPLKIGITCYPSVGGSGVVATELGKALAARGHDVHFITSSIPFRLHRIDPHIHFHEVETSNYAVFQYAPYDIALAAKMAEVIDGEQLDLLHVHYAVPHAICAILARDMAQRKLPIATTLHGTDITVLGQDSGLAGAIRYGIERSDAVTAVSRALARQTRDVLGTDKEIETIYNFVDPADYYRRDASELRRHLGIEEDEKVLIHVSNFRKVKRVEDAVRMFALLRERMPARLLLVGDGPERHNIHCQVQEAGLADDVLFLGKQEAVAELFSVSDLAILLSETEAFGLVLIEAMACGVPCIGTAVGGVPEVIDHGENGWLVPLGDCEGAARYAEQLLRDPSLWARFSKSAVETATRQFSLGGIVHRYEELYERLVKPIDGRQQAPVI